MFAFCFAKLEAGQITEEENNGTRLLLIMAIIGLKLFSAALPYQRLAHKTLLYHCTASVSEVAICLNYP